MFFVEVRRGDDVAHRLRHILIDSVEVARPRGALECPDCVKILVYLRLRKQVTLSGIRLLSEYSDSLQQAAAARRRIWDLLGKILIELDLFHSLSKVIFGLNHEVAAFLQFAF